MSKLTRRDKRARAVRVLAIAVAALLVIGILASTLPLFAAGAEEAPRNRYDMDIAFDMETDSVTVSERLDYENTSGRSLDCVMFTLYANLFRRAEALPVESGEWDDAFPAGYTPGGVSFSAVRVNGEAADWSVSGTYEQFLRVPCALEDGERAEFEFEFILLLSENGWAMGTGGVGWRLTSFYPAAAAYDPYLEDFALIGWTAVTDPMMGDRSDFSVRVRLNERWTLASTGRAAREIGPDGMAEWTIEAEGARDFSLAVSRRMNESVRTLDSGLTVRAYATTASTAKAMAADAAEALAQYEAWFGACPQDEIELMESDLLHGMTRPGLILLPKSLCGLTKRAAMAEETAALCAGQWFGCGAGCNPDYEPWMNDTLSAYAALLYYEEKEGYDRYLKRLNDRVLNALQITIPGGLTVDSDASRFTSRDEYELIVIERGMAVLHETRSLMGRETFLEGLRRYVEDNAESIASVEQFAKAFNDVTDSRWDEYIVGQMHTISDYVDARLEWFE